MMLDRGHIVLTKATGSSGVVAQSVLSRARMTRMVESDILSPNPFSPDYFPRDSDHGKG